MLNKLSLGFVTMLFLVTCVKADGTADERTLIMGIKKSDPHMVYNVLNKGTIDFSACGEFNYLDFACCKLASCIEKIEHYKEKHKKWSDRIGSDYDQELVNQKIDRYKALVINWTTLKQQVQYIVQLLAYYLGLNQADAALIEEVAENAIEIASDVDTLVQEHQATPATPVTPLADVTQ